MWVHTGCLYSLMLQLFVTSKNNYVGSYFKVALWQKYIICFCPRGNVEFKESCNEPPFKLSRIT